MTGMKSIVAVENTTHAADLAKLRWKSKKETLLMQVNLILPEGGFGERP